MEPFGADDWDAWMASVLSPRWYDAFIAVWRRPWMSLAADTYGSSLLDVLGVNNVFADSLERYPEVELAEVAARAPNLILLPSEPYEFGPEHAAEVEREVQGVRSRSSTAATSSGGASAPREPPPASPGPCAPDPRPVGVPDPGGGHREGCNRRRRRRPAVAGRVRCGTPGSGCGDIRPISMS